MKVILAILVILVVFIILLIAGARIGASLSHIKTTFAGTRWDRGGSGPYNIQLYDSPRYYPFYMGRDWTNWDADNRCSAHCRDDGCAVVCR